jgi:hypothetical protein
MQDAAVANAHGSSDSNPLVQSGVCSQCRIGSNAAMRGNAATRANYRTGAYHYESRDFS